MKYEIERKFLVEGDGWRKSAGPGLPCEQGYISSGEVTVRVRRIGDQAFLTLKGRVVGISRSELEYEIPCDEADFMLKNYCGSYVISKVRYRVDVNGSLWEVDEFFGKNRGLVLAEIELASEDQPFEKPEWLGREVSYESRYFNGALAKKPVEEWGD